MNEEEIKAIIILLESTLGKMSPTEADNVVRGVVALLKSKVGIQSQSQKIRICTTP